MSFFRGVTVKVLIIFLKYSELRVVRKNASRGKYFVRWSLGKALAMYRQSRRSNGDIGRREKRDGRA